MPGSDPRVDAALTLVPKIHTFLRQSLNEKTPYGQSKARMQSLLSSHPGDHHGPRH